MGFNKQDFEKYSTGILYIIVVLAIIYKFIMTDVISSDGIYFATVTGSFFLGRKIAKYVTSRSDASNSSQNELTTEQEQYQMEVNR